jgi:hypothetical protein
MCCIVVKSLKCVTQSGSRPDPIAPKSVSAFYGAAKIDNLFENQIV